MLRAGRSWSGNERNCCFLNVGNRDHEGTGFANISALSGLDYADDGRSVAVLDWEQDGDLDVWLGNRSAPRLRLMRNEAGRRSGQYLALRLEGNGITTNRDAVGARVEVILRSEAGHRLIKTVRAGEGFVSQSSKWLHFGLGTGEVAIDKVVVRWPRRGLETVESFVGLEPNQRYLLPEGGRPRIWSVPNRQPSALRPMPLELPKSDPEVRISPITLFQAPEITYQTFQGQPVRWVASGQWTWLNLWATWCAPCLEELKGIAERAADLEAANIHVLALAVDALNSGAGIFSAVDVEEFLQKADFPHRGGLATKNLVAAYQQVADQLSTLNLDLPVPTSFLINPRNQVVAVYKGVVDIDTVLDDAAIAERSLDERWERALSLGGHRLPHERVQGTASDYEAYALFRQGVAFQGIDPPLAARAYQDSLRYKPAFHEARVGLGETLQALGQIDAAEVELQRVLAEDSGANHAEAHYALSLCALKRGEVEAAMMSLEATVRHDGDHVNGLNNLSYLLATHADPNRRDPVRAIDLAQRAVALGKEGNANQFETLATAYLAAGQPEAAFKAIAKAIGLAKELGDSNLVSKLEQKKAEILKVENTQGAE